MCICVSWQNIAYATGQLCNIAKSLPYVVFLSFYSENISCVLSPVCKAPIIVVFGLPLCCGYGVTGCKYVLCYIMQLSCLNHGYPSGGFFVWYFLKSACPLDGTGGSGQSPRAFWTWSHALWLKVGNSVISLRICVCLWHPCYKVRWIMCN